MTKKIIGFVLILTPFVVMAVFMIRSIGFLATAGVWGAAVVMFCFFAFGMKLLMGR
jgi:hypothetical protein